MTRVGVCGPSRDKGRDRPRGPGPGRAHAPVPAGRIDRPWSNHASASGRRARTEAGKRPPGAVGSGSMKETVIDPPLIGSGSQEEADARVQILLDLGKSRGYLTYEELNEKLPDEVVSPDKLDSLLMMIDEMGIKLIDEADIGEYQKQPRVRKKAEKKKAEEEA